MQKLKLAVIGCGGQTKIHHLPAIARSDRVALTMLVDRQLSLARELAATFKVERVEDDYQKIVGRADAALVVLPNHLHAPVTLDLLRKGVHVLVEKPMALQSSECDEMIEAARQTNTVLAVGLHYRFINSSQFVKRVVDAGWLGKITRFDFRYGTIPRWPLASDYLIRKETGGGILSDVGAHLFDLVLWWLGDYQSVQYFDDAAGGVEANCEAQLRLKCGVSGVIEMSRTRRLRNTMMLIGETGTIEMGIFQPFVRLTTPDQKFVLEGDVMRIGSERDTYRDAYLHQVADFADAIRDQRPPLVTGEAGKRAIELMEACHASRQPLQHP